MKWMWHAQVVCHAPHMNDMDVISRSITANWIQYTNEVSSYILHIYMSMFGHGGQAFL